MPHATHHCALLVGLAALVAGAACTERNPAFCDETTACADPERPFCDLDGTFAGSRNTCIPDPGQPDASVGDSDATAPGPDAAPPAPDAGPACSPADSFLRCEGDNKVTCSSSSNEQTELCEFGCVEAAGRCNECAPGVTACEADAFTRCDSDGLLLEQTDCPLGCHATEARCSEMVPSNGLGAYLELAADGDDIVLTDGATINTSTGEVTNGDMSSVLIPSYTIPAPTDGVPIRVFVVNSLTLGDTIIVSSSGMESTAAAIVASDTIVVQGHLKVRTGGVFEGPCVGGPAVWGEVTLGVPQYSGAGGGGHRTAGGTGGTIDATAGGGAGGAAFTNPDLVPLRGGCAGAGWRPLPGGAVQLVAGATMHIGNSAIIDANGSGGDRPDDYYGNGGSAGGGILIEAPAVTIGAGAAVVANGGGGSCSSDAGENGHLDASVALGAVCGGPSSSNGGQGGAREGLPGNGGDLIPSSATIRIAGSGGGAAGYVRINSRTGSFTIESDSVISPEESTGVLVTQ